MTDQAIDAAETSRISRRNALKAAAAVGVGTVAWSGPQITAFGATPAYADGCTGFTVNQFTNDRNTNQGGGCVPFRYQDDPDEPGPNNNLIAFPPSYFWDWDQRECPGNEIKFSFPENITCRVTIYHHDSNRPYTEWFSRFRFQADGTAADNDLVFALPGAPVQRPEYFNNYSQARFSVQVQCLPTSQKGCWDEDNDGVVFYPPPAATAG